VVILISIHGANFSASELVLSLEDCSRSVPVLWFLHREQHQSPLLLMHGTWMRKELRENFCPLQCDFSSDLPLSLSCLFLCWFTSSHINLARDQLPTTTPHLVYYICKRGKVKSEQPVYVQAFNQSILQCSYFPIILSTFGCVCVCI
jgi:hypothetical protein